MQIRKTCSDLSVVDSPASASYPGEGKGKHASDSTLFQYSSLPSCIWSSRQGVRTALSCLQRQAVAGLLRLMICFPRLFASDESGACVRLVLQSHAAFPLGAAERGSRLNNTPADDALFSARFSCSVLSLALPKHDATSTARRAT